MAYGDLNGAGVLMKSRDTEWLCKEYVIFPPFPFLLQGRNTQLNIIIFHNSYH